MKTLFALALLFSLPVAAQPAPVTVYFAFGLADDGGMLDKTMQAVLERSEFLAATKRDPEVLEVALQGRVAHAGSDNARHFTFTLGFWRNGDKLGESAEDCRLNALQDCIDQIASDIASASEIRH